MKKRIIEYFAFTGFNWLIVIPVLTPYVLIRLAFTPEQYQFWLMDSIFVSMFLGFWTTKMSAKFATWFYKRMGWKKERNICRACLGVVE